jgi:hypothetical protein
LNSRTSARASMLLSGGGTALRLPARIAVSVELAAQH